MTILWSTCWEQVLEHHWPFNSIEQTALHCAAEAGHEKVVALLLTVPGATRLFGKASSIAPTRGQSALHAAVMNGHANIVRQLLDADPSLIDVATQTGKTALHIAVELGQEAIVSQLLAIKPQLIGMLDDSNRNILFCAVMWGRQELAKYLLNMKPDLIDGTDYYGMNILHVACRIGHAPLVELLLSMKPELAFQPNSSHATPLHAIVTSVDCNQVTEKLLNVNPHAAMVTDDRNQTPFSIALINDNEFVVNLMMTKFVTFDEAVSVFVSKQYKEKVWLPRLHQLVECECQELERTGVNRDVVGTVYGYLGFEGTKRRKKRKQNKKVLLEELLGLGKKNDEVDAGDWLSRLLKRGEKK